MDSLNFVQIDRAKITPLRETCNLISADLAEVRSWLDIVYGDMPGYLNICSTGNWEGRCFTAAQIDEAVTFVDSLDRSGMQGIYARVTSLRAVPDKGRGSEAESLNLPGLWADLDICGPGHKTDKPLPATVEDAMRIIEVSGLPEPTVWIHSGGGLYPWWLLANSVEITDLESMKILSSNWQTIIEHASKKLGYSYGTGVKDLARVLRIPGTINRKIIDNPHPCQVMYEHSGGRQYTIDELTEAMLAAMPELPPPPPRRDLSNLLASGSSTSDRPGDDFNARADWRDLLSDWEWIKQQGGTWYLRRPGKSEGISATIGHSTDGVDRLYVFSDATAFEQNRPYDKYGAYVLLQHGGNFREATRTLSAAGYGKALSVPLSVEYPQSVPEVTIEVNDPVVESQPDALTGQINANLAPSPKRPRIRQFTEKGFGPVMNALCGDEYRYVAETKDWRSYSDGLWIEDTAYSIMAGAHRTSDYIDAEAERILNEARKRYEDMPSDVTKLELKAAERIMNTARSVASDRGLKAVINQFRAQPGISVGNKNFNANMDILVFTNGTYELNTKIFREHRPSDMSTKGLGYAYDGDAKAPQFEAMISQILPQEATREYLQRSLGYTLTGDANQGAWFIWHGRTGCGKSTMNAITMAAFGDHGITAAAGTFRAKYNESGPSNDLDDLLGARFISTSETSKHTKIDEELMKRFTGGDAIRSRGLYEKNREWRPSGIVTMLTNHKPILDAEDSATWRRVKLVHFPESFYDEGSPKPDTGLAARIINEELPGVMNWLLAGLDAYREIGLDEPEAVKREIAEYRAESDTVQQFITENTVSDGPLILGEAQSMSGQELWRMFTAWCVDNKAPSGKINAFWSRLDALGYTSSKDKEGLRARRGVGIRPGTMLGQAQTPRNPWGSGLRN